MHHPPLKNLLDRARDRDRIGDRVHVGFGVLFMFSLSLGSTPAAIAFGILAGYSILRIWATWRVLARVGDSLIFWLVLAQAVWWAVSLLWSIDRTQGVDEVAMLRCQFLLILFIWPVIDRAAWLALGVILGSFAAFVVQIGQWLEIEWFVAIGFTYGVASRPAGVLHPSLTAVLAISAGVFLMAGPIGRSSKHLAWRVPALVMIGASILFTGSRGPWLATLVSWPFAGLLMARRSAGAYRARWLVIFSLVVVAVLAGIGWLAAGERIAERVRLLNAEVKGALIEGNYRTDVGVRIKQLEIAARLTRDHPILGVGAGSYHRVASSIYRGDESSGGEADETSRSDSGEDERVPIRHHPHSALAYAFAITGIPGGLLYLAFWIVLSVQAWRVRGDGEDGLPGVLPALVVGLFIAFAVDCQNLSMPGMSVLMFATAIVMRETITKLDNSKSSESGLPGLKNHG